MVNEVGFDKCLLDTLCIKISLIKNVEKTFGDKMNNMECQPEVVNILRDQRSKEFAEEVWDCFFTKLSFPASELYYNWIESE